MLVAEDANHHMKSIGKLELSNLIILEWCEYQNSTNFDRLFRQCVWNFPTKISYLIFYSAIDQKVELLNAMLTFSQSSLDETVSTIFDA